MASLTSKATVLSRNQAKHLLRRTSFNVTQDRINDFTGLRVSEALNILLTQNTNKINNYPLCPATINGDSGAYSWVDYANSQGDLGVGSKKLNDYVKAWWIDEAINDETITSKMTLFLFSNFTVGIKNPVESRFYFDYLKLLEAYTLGDWKELVYQITISNPMLIYLDASDNRVGSENENFAREILELFTVGKGDQIADGDYTYYKEQDVVAAAKVLTGLKSVKNHTSDYRMGFVDTLQGDESVYTGLIDTQGNTFSIKTGEVNVNNHNYSEKIFSNYFDNSRIDEYDVSGKTEADKTEQIVNEIRGFVDMIASHDATAKYVCRKLYRFFVHSEINDEIENDIIVPLANTFRANYSLQDVLVQLLSSTHFYAEDNYPDKINIIGGMIKSPLDLVCQVITLLKVNIPDYLSDPTKHYQEFYRSLVVNGTLVPAGMDLFNPESVACYKAYWQEGYDKLWFSSSSVKPRFLFFNNLLNRSFLEDSHFENFISENFDLGRNMDEMIENILDIFLPVMPENARRDYYKSILVNDQIEVNVYSDYNATETEADMVENTKDLFRRICWSQEFQMN